MKKYKFLLKSGGLTAIAAILVACGGGGGGSASSVNADGSVTLSGVAAYGAPYPVGALLTVKDATGATVINGQAIQSSDGSYELKIPSSAVAPFIVSVTSDELPPLVSVAPEKANGTLNITPVTNLVASFLSPSGDPSKLAAEVASGTKVLPADVSAKVDEVKTTLAPLLDAAGVSGNPLTTPFTANGTGMDRVLDSLKVDILPLSGKANVSVGLKTALGETEAPIEVSFQTGSSVASTPKPKLADLTSSGALQGNLVGSGISVKVNELVTKLVSCHAEAIDTRVNLKNSLSATAANIISSTCKSAFIDSDPSKYLSNGYRISGKDHFSGIFWDSGTGWKAENAQLEYIVKSDNTTDTTKPMNGDVVFSFRWRTVDNKTDVSVAQGRMVNGTLYLTGNLSKWDVWVNPRVEKRMFTQANMVDRTYVATGYSVYANAAIHGASGTGKDDVQYIKVTTPSQKILHLHRRTGYDFYVLEKSSSPPAVNGVTSIVRIAGEFLDTSKAGEPRGLDTFLFWANNPDTNTDIDWTDDQIKAIPNQGTWKFELYNSSNTLVGITYRRTIARAPTIAEAKTIVWPSLTEAAKTKIATQTNTTYGSVLINSEGKVSLAGSAGEDYWRVEPNASWLPTGARLSGYYYPSGLNVTNSRVGITDDARFRSDARKATISCSAQGSSDQHCASSGNFKVNNVYTFSQLWGYDSRRVENALGIDTRKSD